MKKFMYALVVLCATSAFGWNCSTSGQVRVQVPAGTVGNGTGDGSGQVVVDNGLTFICEALPTATTGSPITNSNTNSNASNSMSTATGGNANATGGNVNNSGNSSNKNTLSSTNTLSNSQSQSQGQKQSQTQANSSVNSNQSAGGSVSDTGNSSTVVQRSAPMAYAPTIFPSGCNGSISGGASAPFGGISIGGTKQDHHCQQMQTAAMFLSQGNLEAATLILCRTWAARDAKLTLDQCRLIAKAQLPVVVAPVAPIVAPVINPAPIQITVSIPQPESKLVYLTQPHETITVTPKPLGNVRPATKKRTPCKVPQSLTVPMEK